MFRHIIEPGLELRLYEERFADEVFAAVNANRDCLRRFLPWVDKTKSVDDTKAFFHESGLQFANNNGFEAGIWENNRYVGGLGFHWIRWERRFTEIGYWLAADAQGRGIMTKACTAMIDEKSFRTSVARVFNPCILLKKGHGLKTRVTGRTTRSMYPCPG